MFEKLAGKKVLFVTTKNLDYLRNTQEIRLLQQAGASVTVIGTREKSYPVRLLKVFFRLLFTSCKQYDAVFVGFAPQLVLPFFGWKMKKPRLYIDFFISMYDTLCFDRKKFSPTSFVGKRLLSLDRNTLKKADIILCDTLAHGQYFVEDLGAQPDKLQVLYLEADKSIYYPRHSEKPQEAKGKFTVLYFGSVLPLQGIDVVLDAMNRLKNDPRFCFYFIGPIGSDQPMPQGENLHYIHWLSQEELARHIDFADLCLAGHFNGLIEKAKRTIPGKAYIYQAMGKPMILGDNPANHELYSEKENGIYFVEMGSGEKLAEKIMEIASVKEKGEAWHE